MDNNFTGHEQLIEFDGVFKFQNQHESVQSNLFFRVYLVYLLVFEGIYCFAWCGVLSPIFWSWNTTSQVSKEQVAAALPEENKVYPFERVGCEEWCMDTDIIYPLWS